MRKQLLLTGVSHTFRETTAGIVDDLSANYIITLVLTDYFITEELGKDLDLMISKGVISAYFIVPVSGGIKKQYVYLQEITNNLKECQFDVWLTEAEILIHEKYIKTFVLPKKCVTVVFSCQPTFLLKKTELINKLLFDNKARRFSRPKKENKGAKVAFNRVMNKITKFGLLRYSKNLTINLVRRIWFFGYRYPERWKTRATNFYKRVYLPNKIFGVQFKYGKYDTLTQLSSGHVDYMLFVDPLEVKVHKSLYKKDEIYEVQYPCTGFCRCAGAVTDSKSILVPLPGLPFNDEIKEDFFRGLVVAINETHAEIVHLRLHPRSDSKWAHALREYLTQKRVPSEVVSCEQTIGAIICDYIGIVGWPSGALRAARASCDNAVVVAFESLGKHLQIPKIRFGNSEGIGWINEDGGYDPTIFKRKKHFPPQRKTIPEKLEELIDGQIVGER